MNMIKVLKEQITISNHSKKINQLFFLNNNSEPIFIYPIHSLDKMSEVAD